jgi:aspartate aminotransferase
MPGWRLIGGRTGIDHHAVVTLNSNHITSVNEMVNAAGIAALTGPQDIPSQKCAEFAPKA